MWSSLLSAGPRRDPYRGVVFVLLAAALAGMAGAVVGGVLIANPALFDVAVTLGLASGVLLVVARTQAARSSPPALTRSTDTSPVVPHAVDGDTPDATGDGSRSTLTASVRDGIARILRALTDLEKPRDIRVATGAAGAAAIALLLLVTPPLSRLSAWPAGIGAVICLIAAGLAATAAHYLADIDVARFPEALGLCRGARVVAWLIVLAAVSMGLLWAGQLTVALILGLAIRTLNALICYGLAEPRADSVPETFPSDLGLLATLGSRPNVLASVLDSAERQFGIDLRSTWALTIVRRSLEPLVIGLCVVGWLSTSLTVVGVEEQGLVERLGIPVGGPPLVSGLHLHWPWPVDRVFRIPVQRVQSLTIGHEGEEGGGPEDVLWSREHAANEYTLLLGNGRDLITVDAAVQFRIADARAWRYHTQNPADALRAIGYRAVMRTTVNRTLADALSENVVTTTARMRAMVQQDADALGLGVVVLGFTVGGMHPPVAVAADYEAVVSAELGKVTAVVNAQALRNQTVPAAESAVLVSANTARAEGANALGKAAGEAASFLALETQYRASPEEYFFRRRLETLEKTLAGRRFTVVDSRFQRDGGVLWVTH